VPDPGTKPLILDNEEIAAIRRDLVVAERNVRRLEDELEAALTARDERYVCECCGAKSLEPFGLFDPWRCGQCFNKCCNGPGSNPHFKGIE
jgi:ribosomal protein L37AE/L43A